jgi:hypothetical protein
MPRAIEFCNFTYDRYVCHWNLSVVPDNREYVFRDVLVGLDGSDQRSSEF